MITASIDTQGFSRSMATLINRVGLDAKRVVKKEVGELVKTLVKISPPTDRNKSMRKAKSWVNHRFEMLRDQNNGFADSQIGASKNGLKYWAANSKLLYAGAADADMTKASTNELRAVFYRSRKRSGSYRLIVPFKSPRRLQKVAITTKILAKKKQVLAVGSKIAKNFGRLKCGWLVPVFRGAIQISGANMPPKWVTDHKTGARGDFLSQLDIPGNPSFTIINRAKGTSSNNLKYFVNSALKIRAKAMAANAKLILAGKKEYTY